MRKSAPPGEPGPLDEHARRALAEVGRGRDARSTDISSGGGVPAWIAATLNHCTRCGATLAVGRATGDHRDRLACNACGLVAYVNPRLVVGTLPVNERGDLMLLRRGIEPCYDQWAQPGGYLEIDETVGEAAVRETHEETGLIVEPGHLVGLYSRLEAAVIVIVFEARIVGGAARIGPESLEVRAFDPGRIPWDALAFKTTFWAVRDWMALRHPAMTVPDRFRGRDGY
jgi:ADP-ribose pyrophosphatase YjhB (NUDIX family)